ncbi:PEP-CTERM sorting domain-containing protein [Microcystis aeruginosa CS-564/01]|uniref:PEP-CTERM sorting domain-containing protein n=1 Tax=Microcystis aeruginosa TaxID=1126 RepID=UPI00232C4944|nr:PEP-CTERM sorting domain-containing protein [Microcystis aeruginosa]MDB9424479.1 PEP-CTERM sorting domain-containing protein [Microcystis aeruginosa CS-564/01]
MKLTTKSLALSTATFGLMLGLAQNAQAGRITGVTISATSPNLTQNWQLINVINGSGLPGNKPSLNGIHALPAIDNAWRTDNATAAKPLPSPANPLSITFKLGAVPTNLGGLSFWNMTGTSRTMGVQNANLEYSTDGSNFSSLWTGSFAQGTVAASGPEKIDFNRVEGVTHVRLNITSNYGQAQRVGFNEIAFKSIPEPSASLALLGLGLAGVGLRKRI